MGLIVRSVLVVSWKVCCGYSATNSILHDVDWLPVDSLSDVVQQLIVAITENLILFHVERNTESLHFILSGANDWEFYSKQRAFRSPRCPLFRKDIQLRLWICA